MTETPETPNDAPAPTIESPASDAAATLDIGSDTATIAAPEEIAPAPKAVSMPADMHGWWRGTGRRKSAVARVRFKNGEKSFKVNGRDLEKYFTEERDLKNILSVLEKTSLSSGLEIHVNADGGGFMGQAGAVILGLGRALLKYDASLEPILRDNGYLTRDARQVERKKYGQPGARKRFQFSKR